MQKFVGSVLEAKEARVLTYKENTYTQHLTFFMGLTSFYTVYDYTTSGHMDLYGANALYI